MCDCSSTAGWERENEVCLDVADDGVGILFGLVTVRTLAQQIGGTILLDGREGTRWSMAFRLREGKDLGVENPKLAAALRAASSGFESVGNGEALL